MGGGGGDCRTLGAGHGLDSFPPRLKSGGGAGALEHVVVGETASNTVQAFLQARECWLVLVLVARSTGRSAHGDITASHVTFVILQDGLMVPVGAGISPNDERLGLHRCA